MRAAFFLSLAVAIVALAAPTAQAAERAVVVGGYRPVEATPELRALLFDALHNEATYADDVGARVCVADVVSVAQQVVAGMNYRFTTSACDIHKTLLLQSDQSPTDARVAELLGECKPEFARKCVEVDAVVTVYRALDDTKSVSRIETTDKPVSKPTEKPAAEGPAAQVVVRVHAAKEI